MKRICPYCNTEFEASRKDKNYCSPSCRQQAYMVRKGVTLIGIETSSDQTVITSNDVFENSIKKNDVSNDNIKPVEPIEKEYKFIRSSFLETINNLLNRNYDYELGNCSWENPSSINGIDWINVRLRCLIEALLTLSERNYIGLNDLIEVTNAFTLMLTSLQYKQLPESYPYNRKIKEMRDKLKNMCLDVEGTDEMSLKLGRGLKSELIVMRCELRTVAPKKTFNQLEFKTKKPCETNHHHEEKPQLKQWQINYQKMKKKD